MGFWHVFLSRLRSLRSRPLQDQDLTDELEAYVATLTDRYEQKGLGPQAARRAALLEAGGLEAVKEGTRDVRLGSSIGAIGRDLRSGIRVVRRAPGFAAVVVLILGLGVGANGAVFSILRAVLLQPLPYSDPSQVVMVWTARASDPSPHDLLNPALPHATPSSDESVAIHDQASDVLTDSATYLSWQGDLEAQFDLGLTDRVERLRAMLVTPNFFSVLGVKAAVGRVFSARDNPSEPVVVLGDALWRRDFGGDSSIIGRRVTFSVGRPRQVQTFTVLGILPPAFRFTYPQETELWAPLDWTQIRRAPGRTGYWTVARLAPGVTLSSAQSRVAAIPTSSVRRNLPRAYQRSFVLQPVTEWVTGETRPAMLLLAGVSFLLLVITCATVAGALIMRTTERQREFAVRAALGADRGRLTYQLVAEGFVLAVAGAAVGTIVAVLLGPALRALMPSTVPRADELGVDTWLLTFFVAAAGFTTLVATVAPAWRGARFDVVSTLKRASGGASADRFTAHWRRGLVGAETAIATTLLLVAALLLVSLFRLSDVPLGFDSGHLVTLEMRLISPKYQDTVNPGPPSTVTPAPALVTFQERVLGAVRAIPGVLDAGLTSAVPFRGVDFVYVLGRVNETHTVPANARFVDPGYFSVFRVPLLSGRLLDARDTATTPPVIVISAAYARQLFGSESPVGHFIQGDKPLEVVGVVGDVRYAAFDRDPFPAIYFPRAQFPNELICVVARVAPSAGNLGPAMRAVVRQLDPDVPAMNYATVDQIMSESVASRRFYTIATAAFAVVALFLTIAGLVVVVSRAVLERRRELAIRGALGATAPVLVRLVVSQGLPPVVVGAAVGLGAVAAGARLLEPFLFHVGARPIWAYGGVGLLLIAVAAAATIIPALRASRFSPSEALRAE